MIHLQYADFDDLFFELNQDILLSPSKYISKMSGSNGKVPFMVIELDSWECDLDLADMFYTKNKFNKLLESYLDKETWLQFKDKLGTTKSTACTLYFKQSKPKRGSASGNGPCLLSIVLTRIKRTDKWNEATISYRTTELNRRFAADLVLFNRIMDELPSCCDIEKVNMVIPGSYVSGMVMAGQLNLFGVERKDIETQEPFHKALQKKLDGVLQPDHKLSPYKAMARIQRAVNGQRTYKSVPIGELSISEYFETH